MKTTYEGIDIEYDEQKNSWDFVLRGRQRHEHSLAAAKDTIDKTPAEKKAVAFPRQKAFKVAYDGISEVEVTSFAGYESHVTPKKPEFWIMSNGRREKRSRLLAFSEENKARIQQSKSIERQVRALQKQASELIASCAPFAIPVGIDAGKD